MAKIKRYTADDGNYHGELGFYCPGCKQRHFIYDIESDKAASNGHCWSFNKNYDEPTLSPSILVQWPNHRCHSFVREGKIQFLSDCTHVLAGQTIELHEIE